MSDDRCPTTGLPLIWGPTTLADISMARAQSRAWAINDDVERAGWRDVVQGLENIYERRTRAIAEGKQPWWPTFGKDDA